VAVRRTTLFSCFPLRCSGLTLICLCFSEFEKCPVLYLNEPPLECEASCGWGAVRAVGDLRLHQQIYTLREIEAGYIPSFIACPSAVF
jgi:hypothetical protein